MRRSRSLGSMCALLFLGVMTILPRPSAGQPNGYNSIGLEWTAGGDDGDIGRATAYELRYSTIDPAGDVAGWWNAGTTLAASALPLPGVPGTTDSARVTGLTPGTRYYFVLLARDDAWNASPFSNVCAAATESCDAPTVAPQSFDAVAESTAAVVSWSGSDSLATSLHLYRSSGGGFALLMTLPPSATSYRDESVQPGRTYAYRAAWAAACADGPSTAERTVAIPGEPSTSTALGGKIHAYPNPSSGSVRLAITVDGTRDAPVALAIFDMAGRRITELLHARLTPGTHEITWTRAGAGGAAVSPGYYEILGSVGTTKVRERIVLLP